MDTPFFTGSFQNISQRAAASYLRSLARLTCILPEGSAAEQDDTQRAAACGDLHDFFRAFYTGLYEHPEGFGLPLAEDFAVGVNVPTEVKTEANRRLKKPREIITKGLGLLLLAGSTGRVAGQELVLEPAEISQPVVETLKKWRAGRKFLEGLQAFAGLNWREEGERVVLTNPRFPAMMTALRALAVRCAEQDAAGAEDKAAGGGLGSFNFARCDFLALEPGYQPTPPDLYRLFEPADCERLTRLHEYFTGRGYKAAAHIYGIHAWEVKYQGRREVKGTPLFQVEYQERDANPLNVYIKCASTNRIGPLVMRQPQFLQDDFFSRINLCRGDACGWCYNKKNLGPTTFERGGQTISACWYTNPDVTELTEDTVALVQQYALMHEELAPVG